MYCENCRDAFDLPRRNSMLLGPCCHCGEQHLCYDETVAPPSWAEQTVLMFPKPTELWANRPGRLRKIL